MTNDYEVIEIKNRILSCHICKSKNLICGKCRNFINDRDYFLWATLTKLVGKKGVIIRYSSNLANRAMSLIELLKNSVGLIEKNKKIIKHKITKHDLQCGCGNTLTIYYDNLNLKTLLCKKCRECGFSILLSKDTVQEKTDVTLEKIPAVMAMIG